MLHGSLIYLLVLIISGEYYFSKFVQLNRKPNSLFRLLILSFDGHICHPELLTEISKCKIIGIELAQEVFE